MAFLFEDAVVPPLEQRGALVSLLLNITFYSRPGFHVPVDGDYLGLVCGWTD